MTRDDVMASCICKFMNLTMSLGTLDVYTLITSLTISNSFSYEFYTLEHYNIICPPIKSKLKKLSGLK